MAAELSGTRPVAGRATTDIELDPRGEVLWVTLDRPERLNAITPRMVRELYDTFDGLARDPSVRVVVLRGRGRGFCAGLDIRFAGQMTGGDVGLPDVITAMRACPQPIIALVDGPACGGGFAFALAADIRIAGPDAAMNVAFVRLGVSGCEMGVSYFLPRIVGLSVAGELMYTGRFINAERALQTGLVSAVCGADELEQTATDLAGEMLRVAPLALRKTKQTLGRAIEVTDLATVMAMEEAAQMECMRGGDFEEGVRAFLEGREPRFGLGHAAGPEA
ncbi:enoyl-CoA hydratase [Thermocatellispora tengchongensis]|uniref:Enoyl-CoA hydratase n=1 Tax=Thermocatellispora tengchongensis TaxID=1073253 RepID=A0A840P414_9ACTN|nr:enoyl-CoA hydratase-related protein [Thermocatellispora tengchongensis]MBB5136044.1 enoyl-CoA hydratase [Thermocatellispora tengchongensis]